MKQFIQIAATTGHVYEIPVAAIAANRAQTMLAMHSDEFKTIEEAMADTVELFKDSLYDIKDWATNNMNWSDLETHTRLIRFNPPAFDFVNDGEWTYHDHRAMNGELDAATIMKSPVEFVASTMAEARQICGVTVLNNEQGESFGAIAMIIGEPEVIKVFVSTLTYTAEQIGGGAMQTAAKTH